MDCGVEHCRMRGADRIGASRLPQTISPDHVTQELARFEGYRLLVNGGR
jgi:hypothetical protein